MLEPNTGNTEITGEVHTPTFPMHPCRMKVFDVWSEECRGAGGSVQASNGVTRRGVYLKIGSARGTVARVSGFHSSPFPLSLPLRTNTYRFWINTIYNRVCGFGWEMRMSRVGGEATMTSLLLLLLLLPTAATGGRVTKGWESAVETRRSVLDNGLGTTPPMGYIFPPPLPIVFSSSFLSMSISFHSSSLLSVR